jgi:Leucine-rich repeat (LRR) protein
MEQIFPYIFLTGLALLGLGFPGLAGGRVPHAVLVGVGRVRLSSRGAGVHPPSPHRSVVASTMLFAGVLLVAGPPVVNRLLPIDLGPLERTVGGELHLTLTGWDRKDYSVLRQKPHVVVLQMANPDVEDQTLGYLAGMDRLRELDLNGSKVTDAGLKELRSLPNLESLRLKDTAVTDAGFRESLGTMDSLKQLDLRGTRVSREVVQSWKDAKPGRRALQ